MSFNWSTIVVTQFFVWLIILVERKHFKKISKGDKITFIILLSLATVASFFNLIHLPGPLSMLRAVFGSWSKLV